MPPRSVVKKMSLADTQWHEVGIVPSLHGRILAWSIAVISGGGQIAVCDDGMNFADASQHKTYGRVSMTTDPSQLWVLTDTAGTVVSIELVVIPR